MKKSQFIAQNLEFLHKIIIKMQLSKAIPQYKGPTVIFWMKSYWFIWFLRVWNVTSELNSISNPSNVLIVKHVYFAFNSSIKQVEHCRIIERGIINFSYFIEEKMCCAYESFSLLSYTVIQLKTTVYPACWVWTVTKWLEPVFKWEF